MNISKPTAVKHNIHGIYDKNIGDVLCSSNTLFTCDKQMIISGPTQVKHNIHGFFDSITGQVVISHPKMKASEVMEENEVMYILAAQLYSFASNTDVYSTHTHDFQYLDSNNMKFREFTKRITSTRDVLSKMRRDKLWSDHTIERLNTKIEEMKNHVCILQNQLLETRQSKEKETKANILLEQQKSELRDERDRSEKELSILKSQHASQQDDYERFRKKIMRIGPALKQEIEEMRTENFELQKENYRLKQDRQHRRTEMNNINQESTNTRKKLSWTENRSPRSIVKESVECEEEDENEEEECSHQQRVCLALKKIIEQKGTENFELQKENERLTKDLQQLRTEINNLNQESTTTRHKLSWTGNRSPRSIAKESVECEEKDENEEEECSHQQTARGKQVHYNISASSVQIIDQQSSTKFGQRGDETD